MRGFQVFYQGAGVFQFRNQRMRLNRLSLRADLLERRSRSPSVDFKDLMQTDFILFLRTAVDTLASGKELRWWPETLVYAGRLYIAFEVFGRAQSKVYFDRIKGMLGVTNVDELKEVIYKIGPEISLPRWEFDSFDPRQLTGIEELATSR